jgi:hypothetical protein
MKNGFARFEFFMAQLQLLLDKAENQKNPGLYLYLNKSRTPIFMLEGLCKIYAGMHNKKKFSKLKEHFKLLEDTLGAIDYYDSFAKDFATSKNIPATVTKYLQAQSREKIQQLNEILTEQQWLGAGNKRMKKIRQKLEGADWQKDEAEVKSIYGFYVKAIGEIIEFDQETGHHFSNVEADVHELRRKLRWLSIYPQAMNGVIQLVKGKVPVKSLSKYLTKEIITSPFNKMPEAGDNRHFLLLQQDYFYALSWMIAELGILKDNGLRVIAIKEALQITVPMNEEDSLKQAYQVCGKKQMQLPEILKQADTICGAYFKEGTLQKILSGPASVK